jgi:hypothetical protein
VLLPIVEGDTPYPVRFSLKVLHDYTTRTGHSLASIGPDMADDLLGTIGQLLTSAVRTYVPGSVVPAGFELPDGLDLMERLSEAEGQAVATAIWAAIRVETNPLLKALIAQAPKPQSAPSENGASTLTSASAS